MASSSDEYSTRHTDVSCAPNTKADPSLGVPLAHVMFAAAFTIR